MTSDFLRLRSIPVWLALALVASPAMAAGPAAVAGLVRDAADGSAVEGAMVAVAGTGLETVTDAKGRFELPAVSAGSRELTAACPGYRSATLAVRVAGPRLEVELELTPIRAYDEAITVLSPAADAGTSVFYRSASPRDPLNGPATSAAEALQRLPGAVVLYDKGEADRVLVRGAGARLVATSLDGERLPSTVGEERTAGLGSVPLELLEAVTLAKTFSPDRDADAIGGTVDLVTVAPPTGGLLSATAGGGIELPGGGKETVGAFRLGRRFAGDRLAMIFSATSDNAESDPDRVEARYDGDDFDRLELRDYSLWRRRSGALGRLEWAPSERGELSLRGFWNELSTAELRRRVKHDFGGGEIERELKDSRVERRLASLRLAGSHFFEGRYELDYGATFSAASEREPHRIDTAFAAEDLTFSPDDLGDPELTDPARFRLNEIGVEDNALDDTRLALTADVTLPLGRMECPGRVKLGLKGRHKSRRQDDNTTLFEPDQDLFLSDFLDQEPESWSAPREGFVIGPMVDPELDHRLIERFGLLGRRSFEEDAADYDASETVAAGYGLVELALGPRVRLQAGVRYEHAWTDYLGFEVIAGESEEENRLRPLTGDSDDGFVMPAAQVVAELGGGLILRAAMSRTFARPDYVDLVPFELIDLEDEEIERGNPELEVTESWNLDAGLDGPLGSGGTFSVAGFYKSLAGFTYRARSELTWEGVRFEVTEPRSGERADLYGLEVALEQRLPERFLPGLSVEAHFTLTDSTATFRARPKRALRLPGQASYAAHLMLAYHRQRFSAALAANLVGDYLFELGGTAEDDVYVDDRLRWDLSADFAVAPRWRLFLQASNLTGEPSRWYQGSPDRPFREDFVGRSVVVGLRLEL